LPNIIWLNKSDQYVIDIDIWTQSWFNSI